MVETTTNNKHCIHFLFIKNVFQENKLKHYSQIYCQFATSSRRGLQLKFSKIIKCIMTLTLTERLLSDKNMSHTQK